MLIQTIQFGMHNTDDTFIVPNTALNYELIAANRFTRQIHFVEMFNFLFDKQVKAPTFLIEELTQILLDEMVTIEESEPFDNDEMVGSY